MEPPILYEDTDLVAIDKPSGMMTHPDGKTVDETASDWFAKHYPGSKAVGETQRLPSGEEIARPGVVHRLDRETSGVLVFAKTQEAHAFLKNAFKEHDAKKTYLAFVSGVPKERKGTIDFPIGRSRQDFRLRSAQPKAKGMLRDAVTHYEVIADNGAFALLKIRPETGRTHQIRVHLKAVHHPVIADPLYAPKNGNTLGLSRLALHAYAVDIPLMHGGRHTIIAPVPGDFSSAIAAIPGAESAIASL